MKEEFYREACRRKHRVLGHYLAIQAWLRKLDCIVLQRRELEHFLGLERFKGARITWLINDLKPWFPFQAPYYKSKSMSSINSLYLSRIEISSHLDKVRLPNGKSSMTVDQRIKGLLLGAPKTEKFLVDSSTAPPLEDFIVSDLTLVTAGITEPKIYSGKI